MRSNWKWAAVFVSVPLIVGALAGLLTMGSMDSFSALNQPPLSPPGWLFPVVWTILYTLMGIASYLTATSRGSSEDIKSALKFYSLQLVFNFLWSILFFNLEKYLLAFIWLIVLWVLIIITTVKFYRLRPVAAYLMIPYIIWVTFAAYLNLGIVLLN